MRLHDACAILSVDSAAPLADAQKAYRRLALKYHPDRCDDPDATSKFQTIGEAWERVQKYHEDPRRWGAHADPDDPPPPQKQQQQPAPQHDYSSFDEMRKRWFGGDAEAWWSAPPR